MPKLYSRIAETVPESHELGGCCYLGLCGRLRHDLAHAQPAERTWYDYVRQAWVVAGRYDRCGHPDTMACACYGRAHAGELADETHIPAE